MVSLSDQDYTITDSIQTYTIPDWTIAPDYCTLTVDYNIADITNVPGVKAITRADKTFSI